MYLMPKSKDEMMLFLRAYINNGGLTVNSFRGLPGLGGNIYNHLNCKSKTGPFAEGLFSLLRALNLCFVDDKKRKIKTLEDFRQYTRWHTLNKENSWQLKKRSQIQGTSLYFFLRHKSPTGISTVTVIKLANALNLKIAKND